MDDYRRWIDDRLAAGSPWNQCGPWTLEMAARFPELVRVRGTVLLSNGWERDHWWLRTADGQRVDPTATQFDSDYFGHSRILEYFPRDESQPEPTGMCPNCGGHCYDGRDCCSEACFHAYLRYLNESIR